MLRDEGLALEDLPGQRRGVLVGGRVKVRVIGLGLGLGLELGLGLGLANPEKSKRQLP